MILARTVFILGTLLPLCTMALGLGQIRVFSFLNEPLDAEIEVIGSDEYNNEQILASLASIKDFKKANLSRPYVLTKLRFEVQRNEKNTFIKVYSREAIKQPFLGVLIDISWPTGRLLKAYNILLDPELGNNHRLKDDKRFSYKDPNKVVASNTEEEAERFSIMRTMEKLFETPTLEEEPIKVVAQEPVEIKPEVPKEVLTQASVEKLASMSDSGRVLRPKSKRLEEIEASTKKPVKEANVTNLKPAVVEISYMMIASMLLAVVVAVLFLVWYIKKKVPAPQVVMIKQPITVATPTEVANAKAVLDNIDQLQFSDEFAMKLQLARQYMDIGDKESATEVLESIIKNGNPAEQDTARSMLTELSAL